MQDPTPFSNKIMENILLFFKYSARKGRQENGRNTEFANPAEQEKMLLIVHVIRSVVAMSSVQSKSIKKLI
jgi:hypothetical protein